MTFLGLLAVGCGKPTTTGTAKLGTSPTQRLPDISVFLDRPSDRFPVDIDDVCRGHPFMGIDADHPHAGAHAHFDNSGNRWPNGGDEPSNYPAIYAVADGVIARVDSHFHLGPGNDRYGVDLAFAQDGRAAACHFCYSIEPMVAEPSDGFYLRFILVEQGQEVRKGDRIAFMYTPRAGQGTHVHFHVRIDGHQGFYAPAIFTSHVVDEFHNRCDGFRQFNGGVEIPPCMGNRIVADENPFGTGAKERL
jgi:hypothetical protein